MVDCDRSQQHYSYNCQLLCSDADRRRRHDFWIGLYKLTATRNGTTRWYDGNNSPFRKWHAKEPNEDVTCVRLTETGFKDRNCSMSFYYICKKPAGNFCYAAKGRQLTQLHNAVAKGKRLDTTLALTQVGDLFGSFVE